MTTILNPAPRVVWQPLPGSQSLALGCPCDVVLYHGTRGPGKTDWQVMDFKKNVGIGYGRFWRGVIFDREYKNLDDLVEKSKRWFPQFNDGAKFKESKADYKWTWSTGEELLFRAGWKESDYDAYHGHEYPFLGFNELTKQPNSKFYHAIQSCNRSSFLPIENTPKNRDGTYDTHDGRPLPEIPLVVRSTTNPHGVGHNWVKREIIDPAPAGVVQRIVSNVYNPRTKQKEDITRTQTHIFGTYHENRYLSPKYIAKLDAEKDPNKRKAWLTGDWNIVAGGALDDVYDESIHVLPRFIIPENWKLDRSFDWGSTHPFSVGWWAEANGEEVRLPNGKIFCPVAGSLIRFYEWYGTHEIGTNEGLKLGPVAVATGILEREQELIDDGWIGSQPEAGPADNQINNVNDDEVESIAVRMAKKGVRWTPSDKSKGSRKQGLVLVRDRFLAAKAKEEPAIYFMDNCRAAISTLPVLPRDVEDPDDVDTEAEDHPYDDVRYKVLSAPKRYLKKIKVKGYT